MSKAEQFIKDYTRGCSNELCAVEDIHGKKVISYHEWLTPEQALAAVEIARKELIDRACEWIRGFMECSNLFEYEVSESEQKEVINDFKQIMEE